MASSAAGEDYLLPIFSKKKMIYLIYICVIIGSAGRARAS
jgi:hypothetical protein